MRRASSLRSAAFGAALIAALIVVFSMPTVASADDCPNAEFRVGVSALLPDCRAYEQVSPVEKNGGDIGGEKRHTGHAVAFDGSRAIFASSSQFAGPSQGGSSDDEEYFAQRGATGWSTASMVPYTDVVGPTTLAASSLDLGLSILDSNTVLDSTPPDTAGDLLSNVYVRNNVTGVVSPLIAVDAISYGFGDPIVSPDLSHVVFGSYGTVTTDPVVPSAMKVYEITGGQPRLVSFQPDNTPFEMDAKPGGAAIFFFDPFSKIGAISADGAHVFFNAGGEIYRRSNGTTTALVSPSKRTPADPEGAQRKAYWSASPDGNRVLLSSSEQLTDDANTGPSRAGADLYRYDIAADEMIDISATAGGDGAGVIGVVGSSEALDRVYYVGSGQVVPGQGVEGQPNLFLWEDDGTPDGQTRFIATLSFADSSSWFDHAGPWTARSTRDARQVVFQSGADIPGHASGGVTQVYRYDATADGGDGELVCVSCNPDGRPPIGPSNVTVHRSGSRSQEWELPRALSSDGSRVFFSSEDALVDRDSNAKSDAYMWEDGEVHLLSSGTSGHDSYFHNASDSGDDAFILTREALVAQDNDDLADLYDVRVGGGFAGQHAVDPRSCEGDECQGQVRSGDFEFAVPGTSLADSRGNVRAVPVAGSCAAFAGKARTLTRRAQRLRRAANRAQGTRRSARLRRQAGRVATRAKRSKNAAQRCRRANRKARL